MGAKDCFIQRNTFRLLWDFWCSSVFFLSSCAHNGDQFHVPLSGYISAGHERINICDGILPYIKDADEKHFAFGNFTMSSDIVLMKICRVVEEKYIDYLSVLCKKRIVPTGPLVVDANNYDDEEFSEIKNSLRGKSHCSTVYISFGSEDALSKEQISEIAKGLELCDANFLWVIRFPTEEKTEGKLPAGFLEMVKERGRIVSGWAPQTKILAHPSIGGFVSHCGWSSITESMYFAVPIITMPIKSEEPLNARMVVEAGVGVEVGKEGNGHYVGEAIAKAINKVVLEKPFCEDLRNRAKKLSEEIREKEEQEMNEAAEQPLRICMKNKQ